MQCFKNWKIWISCFYLFIAAIFYFLLSSYLFKFYFNFELISLHGLFLFLFYLFVSELSFFPFYRQFSEVSDLAFKIQKSPIMNLDWEWGSFCYRI